MILINSKSSILPLTKTDFSLTVTDYIVVFKVLFPVYSLEFYIGFSKSLHVFQCVQEASTDIAVQRPVVNIVLEQTTPVTL